MDTQTDSIQTKPSGKPKGSGLAGTFIFVLALVAIILYTQRSVPIPPLFADQFTLESALEESRQSGKPIFALVSTEWCPPCKSYKRNALVNEGVVTRLREQTLPVYIDGDSDLDEARFIGTLAYPTTALLIDGAVVAKFEGAPSTADLNEWLDQNLTQAD